MSTFSERLKTAGFAVTSELNPPKGVELGPLFEEARALSGIVDAINLTDSAGSNMAMAPIAVAHLLTDMGIEPILQITGRDRNRIALGGELLAASALGVVNVLCMTGDPPGRGDHPDAMGVFDLKAETLLDTVTAINSGVDMYGNELSGTPKIFAGGAVVNPGADDPDLELSRMKTRLSGELHFFRLRLCTTLRRSRSSWHRRVNSEVPVLAGMIVLKSAGMARFLNNQLPGINVPDSIIAEMESATDRAATGVEVTARLIRDVRDMCDGAHIMAIGWESRIPAILESAGPGLIRRPFIKEDG